MELSIMNAGRGAGKTYNLVQWASEASNRYVVGTTHTRDAMIAKNIKKQFVYLNDAKNGWFAGKQNIEVAFDNFEHAIFDFLQGSCLIPGTNSVILATTIAVWDGAPKEAEIPTPDWYSEAFKKKFGEGFEGAAFLSEALKNGAEALGPLLGVVFPQEQGEKAEPAEEEGVPDTKHVRMDELRLGDILVGRATVVGLRYDGASYGHVIATLRGGGFEGTFRKQRDVTVEIENR